MRVPTVVRPLPQVVRDALPTAATDLYKWLVDAFRDYESVVNGGLEVGSDQNMGVLFDGTFDVTAGTAKEFAHGLGRVPVFYVYYLTSGTMTPAPVIYAESADKADWTADKIKLKCNRDTSVSSLSFSALAF
jgi:hypothetical protein